MNEKTLSTNTEKHVTRVYRSGALAPTENSSVVHAQMLAAHRYYNTLIEIERGRRAAVRETFESDQALLVSIARLRSARADMAAACESRRGSATPDTDALTQARLAEREACEAFRTALRAAQQRLDLRPRLDEITEYAGELGRSARKHCGVFWGTYLLVEAAVQASRRDLPLYDDGEPNDPKFRRWTGEGRLGVHIQGKVITTDGIFRPNTDVYLAEAPRPKGCDPDSKRSQRRRHMDLMLRVGSLGREPIFARFPIVLHRPLPPGAVTWATVALRNIGPRQEWVVFLTVKAERTDVQPEPCGEGDVAIDIGWRAKDDGAIRVAVWKDRAGTTGEIVVPVVIRDAMKQCESLRGQRDENFNVAKAALGMGLERLEAPAWLAKATVTLAQWRSHERLLRLAETWRERRFDGDVEAYDAVRAWRRQELHLWSWESSQRTTALRRRTDLYRTTAATMSRRYGRVVLEAFDIGDVARRAPPGVVETPRETSARANRFSVAVSTFRLAIVQAFVARGGELGKHNPAYTTQTCAACGHVGPVGLSIDHVCAGCGVPWDQDVNASDNLLSLDARSSRLKLERSGAAEQTVATRGDKKTSDPVANVETKWQRAARMKNERMGRGLAAREAVEKARNA